MNPYQKETLNLEVGDFIIWQDEAIPPRARVQFDSGMALMVDERMRWERVADAG